MPKHSKLIMLGMIRMSVSRSVVMSTIGKPRCLSSMTENQYQSAAYHHNITTTTTMSKGRLFQSNKQKLLRKEYTTSRKHFQNGKREMHNFATRNSILQGKSKSNCFSRTHKHLNPQITFCIWKKFYSDMKDDELIKDWLREVKQDFEKEQAMLKSERGYESSSSSEDSDSDSSESDLLSDSSDSDSDVNEIENLKIEGFTSDEIIALLRSVKNMKTSYSIEKSNDEIIIEDELNLKEEEEEEDLLEMEIKELTEEEIEQLKNSGADWSYVVLDDSEDTKKDLTHENEELDTKADELDTEEHQLKTHWSEIEIEDFVNVVEKEPDVEEPYQPSVELTRGETGVYDIADLHKVLQAANAVDIVSISIPAHIDFADHMVIVSAKSVRHMKAIAADVRWIYKRKMGKKDHVVKIEGADSKEWQAMNLGNIVLHIFMPAVRAEYDLETLWTVGPEYDPKCQTEANPYVFSPEDLPWLDDLEKTEEQ